MNQRLVSMAALCREVALPALVLTCLAGSGFAGMNDTRVAPAVNRLAQSLTADASFADKPKLAAPRTIAAVTPNVVTADVVTAEVVTAKLMAPEVVTPEVATPIKPLTAATIADATPAPHEAEPVVTTAVPIVAADEPIVTAALTDSSETLRPETPPQPEAKIAMLAPEPIDDRPAAVVSEAHDECLVVDPCNDRYLWTLYQRTPKEDAVTTQEQRQVTVKRKGKMVTVTRTVRRLADEDFSWKDPKAADHVGMPLNEYVIGGMDRDFKVKLVQMLRAADAAGLVPGITSAFRDDYRQSIASGLKAADNRSYHGGSLRGGYGHGLAADIVSVRGETRADRLMASQVLWTWVDAHAKDFGIGRPYLGKDPPHVAPIDGNEFATHRPGLKARLDKLAAKQQTTPAAKDDGNAAKHARAAKSSKVSAL